MKKNFWLTQKIKLYSGRQLFSRKIFSTQKFSNSEKNQEIFLKFLQTPQKNFLHHVNIMQLRSSYYNKKKIQNTKNLGKFFTKSP